MTSTAKVYRKKGSPYWHAWFRVWDGKKQHWRKTTQSTRCDNEAKALVIAQQYEKLALRAGGVAGDARVSRDFVLRILNNILEISGQPIVEETRKWDEYSQAWLVIQGKGLAERSLESYQSHLRSLTRWLGTDKDIPLNVVTGELLQTWYDEMIDEGRKPKTVNNAVKTVQGVFDRARAEGFCQRNPGELIRRQHGVADVREPFGVADIPSIFRHLHSSPDLEEWLTVAMLGLWTGQRLTDCATAAAQEFEDHDRHLVWHLDQGKTGTKVDIPVVEPLASHLRKLLSLARKRPGQFLCPALAGKPSGGTSGLSMQFSAILDAAKVVREKRVKDEDSKGQSWTNKTFHSFRHTTNSLLANAGVSSDVRRKILGHGSDKMNLRYTHLELDTIAEALNSAMKPLK